MSITGTATMARVRTASQSDQKVTRRDLGKGTGKDAEEEASTTDVLATLVPTAAVAFYTAALAAVAGAVDKPRRRLPNPDQLVFWRTVVFVLLLALAVGAVLVAYYKESPKPRRFPTEEVIGTFVAAAAWGVAMPASFAFALLDKPERMFVPALIGLAGVAILAVMAPMFKRGAKPKRRRPTRK